MRLVIRTLHLTVMLQGNWCQQYPSHSTGDLEFGADGYLYASLLGAAVCAGVWRRRRLQASSAA